MFGRSPYGRDKPLVRELPEAEEQEKQTFVRGTGPQARRVWGLMTAASVLIMGAFTAVASIDSETAGVAAAHAMALVVGFCGGGYVGVVRAQRAGPTVGRPLPLIGAVCGAVFLLGMALAFFEGIWPAL